MAPQQLPGFTGLPEDIREDIWRWATLEIIKRPSLHFFDLSRQDVDRAHETRLRNAARGRVEQAIGPAWNELSRHDKRDKVLEAADQAIAEYRATLVTLAPPTHRAGPERVSPCWKLADLASVSTDAYQSVQLAMGGLVRSQEGSFTNNSPAIWNPEDDLVCLTGPETDPALSWYPFFETTPIHTPEGHNKQVVVVANSEVDQQLGSRYYRELDLCPSLRSISPLLARLTRIAFVYDENPSNTAYYFQLGLGNLWRDNMPALRELYLVDRSIQVTPGGEAQLLASPGYAGYRGTFHVVDLSTADDVWDFTPDWPAALPPVFYTAAWLQSAYSDLLTFTTRVVVRVLAFVPDPE